MTNDTRTSDEIERDIQQERSRMSESINTLQKKFSVEAIVGDIGDMFRTQSGELGRTISQTVGRNPAAVAMVGVGLAWLFLGPDRSKSAAGSSWGQGPSAGSSAGSSWGRDGSRSDYRASQDMWDRPASAGLGSDLGEEDDAYWYGSDEMARSGGSEWGTMAGNPAGWDESGSRTGAGVVGAVKGAAQAVGDAVSGAAGSVGRAASDLSSRLMHGLEGLSEEARDRIVAARRAAHDARLASTHAMKRGARAAANLFDDQPLVVGALAVAVGAAMGGVLPRTRIEDETLGASSDKLFADAQALFRAERDKAMAVVKAAASDMAGEVRDVGSEIAGMVPEGKSVGEAIVDRAADAASRVYQNTVGKTGTDLQS